MLAMKFASSSSAQTTHAPRARVNQRREIRLEDVLEDKGCDCVPGCDLIVVLPVSATGELLLQREGLNDPGAGFVILSYIIAYPRLVIVTAALKSLKRRFDALSYN